MVEEEDDEEEAFEEEEAKRWLLADWPGNRPRPVEEEDEKL